MNKKRLCVFHKSLHGEHPQAGKAPACLAGHVNADPVVCKVVPSSDWPSVCVAAFHCIDRAHTGRTTKAPRISTGCS